MNSVGMKRTIGGAAALALAMAGCATQAAAPTVSPAQLLAAGSHALTALKSSQVTGTLVMFGLHPSAIHNTRGRAKPRAA